MTISIMNFSDYRDFLREKLISSKKNAAKNSLEFFAKKFGLRSRGHLHNVLNKKRNISLQVANRITNELNLSKAEKEYFENMVNYEICKYPEDKEIFLRQLNSISLKNERLLEKKFKIINRLSCYYSHWYYPIIRSLARLSSFKENPQWISSVLNNRISTTECRAALLNLEKWGFLIRGEDQSLSVAQDHCFVDDSKVNESLILFMKKMLAFASQSLDQPRDNRANGTLILRCKKEQIPKAQQMITHFIEKFNTEMETNSPETDEEIYFLNINYFQVSSMAKEQQ